MGSDEGDSLTFSLKEGRIEGNHSIPLESMTSQELRRSYFAKLPTLFGVHVYVGLYARRALRTSG